MIRTYAKFYYGYKITADNRYLDFKEGTGAQRTAAVGVGAYTASDFCKAIAAALNIAGTFGYSVTMNRSTRAITVTSIGGSHTLLTASGTHSGSDPFTLMGFSKLSNTSSAASHTGTLPSGDVYAPQLPLQDYVSSEDLQGAADASINKSASGLVEVVSFGTEKFMECNITLASNVTEKVAGPYRVNATGVEDLRRFLKYLVTKAPLEFMADENTPSVFEKMILESIPESSSGIKYRLKEMYDRKLTGYFETGKLVFRVIEV